MSRWLLGSLLCLTLLLTGCPAKQEAPGDAAADPKAGTPGETVPSTETATQASFPFPTRTAKSLEGNWVLVLSEQGKEFSVALLKITPGSPAKVEELETLDVVPGLALKEGKVAGKDVTLTFDTKNGPADLQGTFQDGIVRGTFAFPPVGLDAARLIPTSADSVKAFPNQRPAAGTEELTAAAQQKEPTKAVWGWARGHRTAPLSLDAYLALTSQIGRAMDVPWNDEIVNALAGHFLDSAKVWGPRMERRAQVQIAVQLAASGKIPEIALQYIDKALPVADSEDMKAQLGFLREANQTLVTMKKLKTATGEEAETLAGELKKALEKQEFNALILQALADHARKTEKYDEAIEYYGQIVALPLLEVSVLQERASEGLAPGDPTPHEQLTEVWKKAHNDSTDGLDAYLDQTYETRLANLKEKARKSAPAAAEPPKSPAAPSSRSSRASSARRASAPGWPSTSSWTSTSRRRRSSSPTTSTSPAPTRSPTATPRTAFRSTSRRGPRPSS